MTGEMNGYWDQIAGELKAQQLLDEANNKMKDEGADFDPVKPRVYKEEAQRRDVTQEIVESMEKIVEEGPVGDKKEKRPPLPTYDQITRFLGGFEKNGVVIAGLRKSTMTRRQYNWLYENNEGFRDAVDTIQANIRDELIEEAIAKAKNGKSEKHLQWVLGKLDPKRFGDVPTKVEIGGNSKATPIMIELVGFGKEAESLAKPKSG